MPTDISIPDNVVMDGREVTEEFSHSGANWAVLNCAFIFDEPHQGEHGAMPNATLPSVSDPDGVGYFKNCYFKGAAGRQCMWVRPSHSGTLVFDNCTFAEWGADALYADEPGKPGAGGGITIVDSCAFVNNNISHCRLSVGSEVRNSYIWNTEEPPPNEMDQVNSRGLHTFYDQAGGEILAKNVHVDTAGHGNAVDNAAGNCTWRLEDCEINGGVDGSVERVRVGNNPQHSFPQGAPTTPSEATGGNVDSGGVPGTGADSGDGGSGSVTEGSGAPSFTTKTVGFDDIPDNLEPPANTVTVDAYVTDEQWAALNALRDRTDPFDIAVGEFTLSDVGITDLQRTTVGGQSGHDVTITLKEHRKVYVQDSTVDNDTGDDEQSSDRDDTTDPSDYFAPSDGVTEVPDADTTNTVNLGEEGLSEGDAIDSYLADHLESGTRVEVPGGTYTWNGGGLSGEYQNAALVGIGTDDTSTDRATLDASNADNPSAELTVTGGGAGSFHMERVTLAGTHPGGDGDARLQVAVDAPGASALFRQVYLPDGSEPGTATGIAVGDTHRGTAFFRNSHVKGFANCGIQSAPANGAIVVEGGLYHNNNVADIQLGSDDSRVEFATIVNDAAAPNFTGGGGSSSGGGGVQRGIWFKAAGEGMQVVETDLYHNVGSGTPIEAAQGPSMSGTVSDSRITNDSQRPAAIVRNNGISFSGVHVTGSGNTTLKGVDAACVGDGCDSADWSGSPDDSTNQANMDEVVIESGQTKTVTVGDDETLSGKIYDMSAEGARLEIIAEGQSWTVADIGIVGQPSGNPQAAVITASVAEGSTAEIRNIYMADGAANASTGIRLRDDHTGALTVSRANIQRFPDYGIHGHRPGGGEGGGGSLTVDQCYLAHNGRANVTLGVAGSDVTNTVIYNDGTAQNAATTFRGVQGWYAETTVTNSDVYVASTAGTGIVADKHGASIEMTNGDLTGGTAGDVTTTDVGSNPKTEIPDAVPDTPAQAAGTDSSSSSNNN